MHVSQKIGRKAVGKTLLIVKNAVFAQTRKIDFLHSCKVGDSML